MYKVICVDVTVCSGCIVQFSNFSSTINQEIIPIKKSLTVNALFSRDASKGASINLVISSSWSSYFSQSKITSLLSKGFSIAKKINVITKNE